MAKIRKSKFLYVGQEVTTKEGITAVVHKHNDLDEVTLMYCKPNWPFPQWIQTSRRHLTVVPLQYEDAPF